MQQFSCHCPGDPFQAEPGPTADNSVSNRFGHCTTLYLQNSDRNLSGYANTYQPYHSSDAIKILTCIAGCTWDTTSSMTMTSFAGASKLWTKSLPIFIPSSVRLHVSLSQATKIDNALVMAVSTKPCAELKWDWPFDIKSAEYFVSMLHVSSNLMEDHLVLRLYRLDHAQSCVREHRSVGLWWLLEPVSIQAPE